MPYFSTFLPLNAVPDPALGRIRRWTGRSPYLPEHDRTQSIFIHIPKAAGTSVSHALYGRQVGHVGAEVYRAADPARFERYFSFSVVRNPEARFLSAWRYLSSGGATVADKQFRDRHLSRFADRQALLERLRQEARAGRRAGYLSWGHFRPQHRFLGPADAVLVDRVIRLEDLDGEFGALSAKILGQPGVLPQLNRSEGGSPEPLNEAERTLVREIYAVDYDAFGYPAA